MLTILLGCGSGSNGSRSDTTATPTPTPTVAAPAPPPPPAPSPTPPLLADEVLLAVGEEFGAELPSGGFVSRPLLLRKGGEEPWTEIEIPALRGLFLHGAVFSSPDTAWAFGFQDARGALLRSDDRGQSWRDVSATLPLVGQTSRAFDLVFVDEHTGYLAVRFSPFGPSPLVFVSRDGGVSWSPVDVPTVPFGGGNVALLARDGAIELLREDDGAAHVEPIDGTPSLPQVLAPAGTIHPGSSASTIGPRGWAAVADGARWVQSAIDGVPSGTIVQSVLCTRDGSAWAITTDVDTGIGARFLHSTDGGATWAPAPTSLGARTQLRGLARSTERE